MYNHLVKTADERVLHFFIKDGLCVKDLLSPSDKYNIIYDEAVNDFAVMDTGFGDIGIVCQNKEGSIIFLREKNGSYLKTTLLNNRSQKPYDKYFDLKLHNNWIGLSYIIEYQDNNILSFQLLDKENEPPLAVDYVSDKKYFSFVNSGYDRIFFYNKENEFGYKIFKWSKKNFIEYIKLNEGEILSAICDFSDNYYIIYTLNSEFFLRVMENRELEFSYKDYPIDFLDLNDEINMLVEKNNLWITVKRKGFTVGRKADLKTMEFSSQYNFFNEGNLSNYKVSINEKEYIMHNCFGYSLNLRPQLILYKELLNAKKTVKPETVIKEENNDMKNKYEIMIDKLNIRIKELEKKVDKISKADEKS